MLLPHGERTRRLLCGIDGLVDTAFADDFVVSREGGSDYLLVPVDGSGAAECDLSASGTLECDDRERKEFPEAVGSLVLSHAVTARATGVVEMASSMEGTDFITVECLDGAECAGSDAFPCEIEVSFTAVLAEE